MRPPLTLVSEKVVFFIIHFINRGSKKTQDKTRISVRKGLMTPVAASIYSAVPY